MSVTDLFFSPTGAGNNSGDSVANAMPATDGSGDWSTELKSQDRQNKSWIFLEGTYNVSSVLVSTVSEATDTHPNFWVGAKSDGTILEPTFDETGMHLDTTHYPMITNSAATAIYDTDSQGHFYCIGFVNTNSSFGRDGVLNNVFGEILYVSYLGCFFKAKVTINTNTSVHKVVGGNLIMCEVVAEPDSDNLGAVLDASGTHNTIIADCRIYGPGKTQSISASTPHHIIFSSNIVGTHILYTLMADGAADGFHFDATSSGRNSVIYKNTFVNLAGDALDFQGLDNSTQGHRVDGNIAFNVDGNFVESDAEGKLLSSKNSYSGSGVYFNGVTEFSVTNTEVSAVTADFFDYDNADYRVKRTSNVFDRFKSSGNMGAFQNEDFEFVSVS